ncbi:MAG TPA: hypothetical protein VLK58_06325 [Conexibacter sp.]|nr:hypothetical protein [Conexibacter sp.]
MQSSDLEFPAFAAAANHAQIRWALFAHPDVRDVLLTLHSDTLRVLHSGPVDADAWSATLTAAGFPPPQIGAVRQAA